MKHLLSSIPENEITDYSQLPSLFTQVLASAQSIEIGRYRVKTPVFQVSEKPFIGTQVYR